MEDIFIQMDKDGSGDISLGELKMGLKDFGLRLTSVSSNIINNSSSVFFSIGHINDFPLLMALSVYITMSNETSPTPFSPNFKFPCEIIILLPTFISIIAYTLATG